MISTELRASHTAEPGRALPSDAAIHAVGNVPHLRTSALPVVRPSSQDEQLSALLQLLLLPFLLPSSPSAVHRVLVGQRVEPSVRRLSGAYHNGALGIELLRADRRSNLPHAAAILRRAPIDGDPVCSESRRCTCPIRRPVDAFAVLRATNHGVRQTPAFLRGSPVVRREPLPTPLC